VPWQGWTLALLLVVVVVVVVVCGRGAGV